MQWGCFAPPACHQQRRILAVRSSLLRTGMVPHCFLSHRRLHSLRHHLSRLLPDRLGCPCLCYRPCFRSSCFPPASFCAPRLRLASSSTTSPGAQPTCAARANARSLTCSCSPTRCGCRWRRRATMASSLARRPPQAQPRRCPHPRMAWMTRPLCKPRPPPRARRPTRRSARHQSSRPTPPRRAARPSGGQSQRRSTRRSRPRWPTPHIIGANGDARWRHRHQGVG